MTIIVKHVSLARTPSFQLQISLVTLKGDGELDMLVLEFIQECESYVINVQLSREEY